MKVYPKNGIFYENSEYITHGKLPNHELILADNIICKPSDYNNMSVDLFNNTKFQVQIYKHSYMG